MRPKVHIKIDAWTKPSSLGVVSMTLGVIASTIANWAVMALPVDLVITYETRINDVRQDKMSSREGQ